MTDDADGDEAGRLPRRTPGKALRDLQDVEVGERYIQGAKDHLKRREAEERLRHPWRNRSNRRRSR